MVHQDLGSEAYSEGDKEEWVPCPAAVQMLSMAMMMPRPSRVRSESWNPCVEDPEEVLDRQDRNCIPSSI